MEKERISLFYSVSNADGKTILTHQFEYKVLHPKAVLTEFNKDVAKLTWVHQIKEHAFFDIDLVPGNANSKIDNDR